MIVRLRHVIVRLRHVIVRLRHVIVRLRQVIVRLRHVMYSQVQVEARGQTPSSSLVVSTVVSLMGIATSPTVRSDKARRSSSLIDIDLCC